MTTEHTSTDQAASPLGSASSEGLGLAPERAGQPRMMTIIDGAQEDETGHWYSPAAVREMLAEERERCAKLRTVAEQVLRDMEAQDVLPEWQTLLGDALNAYVGIEPPERSARIAG